MLMRLSQSLRSTRNPAGVRELEPGASLAAVEVPLTFLKQGAPTNYTHKHTVVSTESGSLTKCASFDGILN